MVIQNVVLPNMVTPYIAETNLKITKIAENYLSLICPNRSFKETPLSIPARRTVIIIVASRHNKTLAISHFI